MGESIDLKQLEAVLAALGIPADKTELMAVQVDKRARQMAEATGRSYEDALAHLLELLRRSGDGHVDGDVSV